MTDDLFRSDDNQRIALRKDRHYLQYYPCIALQIGWRIRITFIAFPLK